MVTPLDVYNRLCREYPNVSFGLLGGCYITFTDACTPEMRKRAQQLEAKAKVFNGHLNLEHAKNKRNWWKRV